MVSRCLIWGNFKDKTVARVTFSRYFNAVGIILNFIKMTSPEFRKSYVPTSTPICSAQEESGYFSISRKNRWLCHSPTIKEFSNLSPVKELSPVRKRELARQFLKEYDDEIERENLENNRTWGKAINFKEDNNRNIVKAISFDCSLSSLINNNISITRHESLISSACYLSPKGKESGWYTDEINDSCNNISLLEETAAVLSSDRSPPSKKFQESLPVNYSNIKPRALTFNLTKITDRSSNSSMLTKNENIYNNILSSIKTNNKHTHVNFIESLQMRNCDIIISKIFVNLSDKDLCNVSFVSQHWRNAVLNDSKANIRRKEFLQQRKVFATGPNKENRFGERNLVSPRKKDVFNNISNNILSPKLVEKPLINDLIHKSKYECFVEEGQKLNDNEFLTKCPKCQFPAKCLKSDTRCSCTHKSCQYVFCTKCLGPYYSSMIPQSNFHKCSKHQEKVNNEPKIIVGSKQSKKNLRRL